jgi:RecB family exonuclease
MINFLEKTANYLFDHYPDDIGNICVVLPNRRAGLFLKKYLSQITDKPIFAPEIFSIDDFVFSLSGYRKIEPAYLLFEFYEVYQQLEGKKARPFRDFIKWAEVVIHDFNEVDLYLVDPDKLFSYLSDSKALSLWNLDAQPLSAFETRYLQFFHSLVEYYQNLRKSLLSKRLAYQGLAYRLLAEELDKAHFEHSWKKILFVGFNALTIAEERIIKVLKERGIADLLWDADPYFLDNSVQEAGHFLRHNKKIFKLDSLTWTQEYFRTGKKNIHLIGVPKNVGQAKVAGEILVKIQKSDPEFNNTSIVLNDENLLSPLLNSLPECVKAFNLTMGLSLENTILCGLINNFILLNENALRFEKSDGQQLKFYFKDLLRIVEHPYFERLMIHAEGESQVAGRRIKTRNQIFYNQKELKGLFKDLEQDDQNTLLNALKPWGNSALEAIDGILFLLKKLKKSFSENDKETDVIDIEYVFHFSKLFNKLNNSFQTYSFLNDLESFRRIFSQMVRSVSIPFYGEPLNGVQIMGMLETRTLDFENIIMLSVNDDFIPGGTTGNSFIPFEIKRKFHLPTHRERNAVFAYHFYRILQRARNIFLLFNTEAGDLGGGDRSRFITQVENELKKYNPLIQIETQILSNAPAHQLIDESIQISKTSAILKKINDLTESGFSASALNIYRNCSLQFYFKYILSIDETEEVEETIEASTMGSVVHDVLFQLYQPFMGKRVTEENLRSIKPEIEKNVHAAFQKHYERGDIHYGKNLLITKVATSFVKRFLMSEEKWLKEAAKFNNRLTIKNLEVKLNASLQVESVRNNSINLKGIIDRIDQLDNTIRVIDYKTGKVETNDIMLKSWEDLLIPGRHDKTFQLLFYAFLFLRKNDSVSADIEVGIFSFRNLSKGLLAPKLPMDKKMAEAVPYFEDILHIIFKEILDPKTPFQQTTESKVCEYCTFKKICNR